MKGKQWNFQCSKNDIRSPVDHTLPLLLEWCEANDYEISRGNIKYLGCKIVFSVNKSDHDDMK